MTAWEEARKNKQRVFYEEYSNTIRVFPENYLLAFQHGHPQRWSAKGDSACKKYHDKIQAIIDKSGTNNGPELALLISVVVPGTLRNHGFDVWQ